MMSVAHVGAEISVSSVGERLTPPLWLPHQYETEPARLPLLCESREGYQNLCQLITQLKMRESTKTAGAATYKDLQQYASGLVCLTGGDEGPLTAALSRGGEEEGRRTAEQLLHIFGRENVYVELQRHQERKEEWRNQAAIRIANSLNLPLNLQQTACDMRLRMTVRFRISLQPFATTSNSIKRAVCLQSIAGVIFGVRVRWPLSFEIFRSHRKYRQPVLASQLRVERSRL